METAEQLELSPQSAAMGLLEVSENSFQEFLTWRENPETAEATGKIMEKFYRICGRAFLDFCKFGVKFSIRFAEEQVRHELRMGKARGVALKGYAINSHLTKPILVHILTQRPEFRPMFEVRDGVKSRYEETIIVKRRMIPSRELQPA